MSNFKNIPFEDKMEKLSKLTLNKPQLNLEKWAGTPDIILEEIFSFLPMKNRARCAQICQNWHRVFLSDKCWETFVYRDYIFTRRRFTIHSGYEHSIDHWKLRILVNNLTRLWRHFVVKPVVLLTNFYEFIRVITNFTEYYENQHNNPLENIQSFEFEWRLHVQKVYKDPTPQVFGTGGRLLQGVAMLLSHLSGLEMLSLRQLLLDGREADQFMDQLLENFSENITNFCLLNLTKTQHSFFHLGLFLNLQKLCVSPQHLNEDCVSLLGQHRNLRNIFLIQDEKTQGSVAVEASTWRDFRKSAPKIRVHLRIRGRNDDEIVWQRCAPVFSVVYDTPASKLTPENAMIITENYSETLRVFVQRGIQRRFRSRKFDERADPSVMMLIRHCPALETLAIRESLSSATILIIAEICVYKSTFHFCVRKNALLKRNDWPCDTKEWSTEFCDWLKTTASDYDKTEVEFCRLLKGKGKIFSDAEYKHYFGFKYSKNNMISNAV